MALSKQEIEQKEIYLNKIFILFDYLFLWVIVWNIWTIFMGAFNLQDNIFRILGIFFVWFLIPAFGLIRIWQKNKNKIIENKILWWFIPKLLFIFNIIMWIFILICIAVNIQNSVIDPENPITVFKWLNSIF